MNNFSGKKYATDHIWPKIRQKNQSFSFEKKNGIRQGKPDPAQPGWVEGGAGPYQNYSKIARKNYFFMHIKTAQNRKSGSVTQFKV